MKRLLLVFCLCPLFTLAQNNVVSPSRETPPVQASAAALAGTWSVYKRTSNTRNERVDYATLVRAVVFLSKPDNNGYLGWVEAAKDPDDMHSWNITRLSDGRLYTTGKSERVFEVLNAGKELVLREGDITYYFKQFK